jgi:hypothetical protein
MYPLLNTLSAKNLIMFVQINKNLESYKIYKKHSERYILLRVQSAVSKYSLYIFSEIWFMRRTIPHHP